MIAQKGLRTYAAAMERGEPFIRMKIDVHEPIELGDFVGAFTALALEYDRYARSQGIDKSDATLFVRDVRDGCIVAELVLWGASAALGMMSAANTIADFVRIYGGRLATYARPGGRVEGATKQQLKAFVDQVSVIANASGGARLSVAALEVENGAEKVRAVFEFDKPEAREIQHRAEEHKKELAHTSRSDHERVLLVFTRSDIGTAPLGRRSGEKVLIESISDAPRPLIYASEMAEQAIKHEITDEPDNVYKKGFVVDVNVETRGGKPVAYAITALHQVIDLDD